MRFNERRSQRSHRFMRLYETGVATGAVTARRSDGIIAASLMGLVFAFLSSPATVVAQTGLATQGGESGKPLVAERVMEGRCIKMVSPRYPSNAATKGQEVVLRVIIDRNGQAHPQYLVSGPPEFENEAMNAVRMWRYRPIMRDDQPIDTAANVRVKFAPGVPPGLISHPSR